jgi:hypothetical protein
MTCEEVRELLPDHAFGGLSEIQEAAVRRHLRGCGSCREEARTLDEGIAMFASAAHAQDPPRELRERVLRVLDEEWAEAPPERRFRWRFATAWQAMAAAVVIIAGLLTWGLVSQASATRNAGDAHSYRQFLSALGGKDVRVGTLQATGSMDVDGNAILYDSDEGQSWIMVLARAPGSTKDLTVEVRNAAGRKIEVPFPIHFEGDGDGWTGMITASDISSFDQVVLRAPDGTVVARGTVRAG